MGEVNYPPQLGPAALDHVVSEIKDWSIANGLAVRPSPATFSLDSDPHGVLATTAPVTIFPSPFPRVCFEQATSIQKAYNELYAAIAQDEEFLQGVVEEILDVDHFIAELWQVHLGVEKDGYVQPLSLGLFRSDYMVHQEPESSHSKPHVKQVEFNTIASSFGGLSYHTSRLHKHLTQTGYANSIPDCGSMLENLPPNSSTHSLAAGIRAAYQAYSTKGTKGMSHPLCVLFVVQDDERNIFDQRHLEFALSETSSPITTFRLPFSQILQRTTISKSVKRELIYHPQWADDQKYEVAVVYFRSGYGPGDYPDTSAWQSRLQIERSNAIKCPTILSQLAGAKKVQQVLATPSVSSSEPSILARFLKQSTTSSALAETFTNIYPLDDSSAGKVARELALDAEKCKGYVLKPQREGGGNNIYRSAIPPFLRSIPESHWKSYILMEIIVPPAVHNSILRNGVVEQGGVICELGVYGTCLWDQETGEILSNEEAGYLLRTKGDKSEEGGVAAGFGAMDSVLLV